MNIVDILKGIENLVVQLLLLLIYIPKTIIKIIRDPVWVPAYISGEKTKSPGYLDYVSPVLFYLILALVPFAIFPDESTLKPDSNSIIAALQSSEGMVRGIIFMAIPMTFAFLIELCRANTFSRANIERLLYIQCYFFAPFIFAIQIRWFLSIFYMVFQENKLESKISCLASTTNFAIVTVCVVTFIWLVIVQWKFLMEELSGKTGKVLAVMITSLILILLITSPIIYFDPAAMGSITFCQLEIECSNDIQWIGIFITIIVLLIYGYAFFKKLLSRNKQKKVKNSNDAGEPLI